MLALGRLRRSSAALARRCSGGGVPFAVFCFVLGFAFSGADGRVGVATASTRTRWQALTVAVRRAASGSTRRTRPATSCSRSPPGPSCDGCSTATRGVCAWRSCGPERSPSLRPRSPLRRVARASFLTRQQARGGFAEPRRRADPAAHRLGGARAPRRARAAGRRGARLPRRRTRPSRTRPTSSSRRSLESALGGDPSGARRAARRRQRAERRGSGRRQLDDLGRSSRCARRAVRRPRASVRYLLRASSRTGGWSWHAGRRTRLERHGRRDPGAARGRRPRQADPPRARLPRRLQNRDGGFELTAGPRLGRPVHRAGRSRPSPPPASPTPRRGARLPPPPPPSRRQLPLLHALRDDPGLGHVTGAGRARPAAVPTLGTTCRWSYSGR